MMINSLSTEKPVDPIDAFRKKVAERIRSDIGDMMPDDMLQKICHDAVKSELYQAGDTPMPWIRDEISELIGRTVKECAHNYINEEAATITKLVEDAFKEQLPKMMAHMFIEVMKGNTQNLSYEIQNILQAARY